MPHKNIATTGGVCRRQCDMPHSKVSESRESLSPESQVWAGEIATTISIVAMFRCQLASGY